MPDPGAGVAKAGAAGSDAMNQTSNELSQELASISDAFANLGERLLGASRQLHSPGSPPPETLIDELAKSRKAFLSLRDRSRQHAESLQVAMPSDESLNTTQGLTALLDLVAEAEIRQGKGEETRRRALSVLDRILTMNYAGGGDFAPLRDCQQKAKVLRDAIDRQSWLNLSHDAGQLAEGDHVFSHLLVLVEDREVLSDDVWATVHESVGATFGKSLAAAAARAKLVLPDGASSAADSGPQEPAAGGGGEKSAGRRNLGKATPSAR